MTTAIKRRRGTTTQHSTFTGLEGEITVDTTKDTVVVHDGSTAGGFALLREDLSNNTNVVTLAGTQTLSNKTFSDNPVLSSGTANGVAYLNGSKVLTTGSALTFDGSFLGVGVTPGTKLDVGGSIRAIDAVSIPYIYLNNGTSQHSISNNAGTMPFAISGGEQMRLTSTGLGIGTSSPGNKLSIAGYSSANQLPDIQISRSSSGTAIQTGPNITFTDGVTNDTTALQVTQGRFGVWNYGGGTWLERMSIDSSGNVGIGTSSPAYTLQVRRAGGAGSLGINIDNTVGFTRDVQYYAVPDSTSGNSGHAFYVRNASATDNLAMRIEYNGNVGIGTSSPSYKLDVVQASGANTVARFYNASAGGNADFYLNNADNAGDWLISRRSNGEGWMYMSGTNPLVFLTNATERMRIDSSGNLLVGTTSLIQGSEKAAINFSSNIGPGLALSDSTIQNGATFVGFFASTTRIGAIVSNGTTNVAYNTSSDYRLKENIQPMHDALGVVAQLNPVRYTWKADGSDGQGFIAHELQAVVPDCVTGEKDAVDAEGKPVYQGIDTSFLVATLTKAIQELNEKVTQQAAEIAALKGA